MDRNLRHGSYPNGVGPRSMPHMMPNGGGKRHAQDGRYSGDVRHSDIRHSDVRHSDARHSDVRHSEVRHSEVRHTEVRHSDIRHPEARHSGEIRHSGDVRHSDARDVRHSEPRDARDVRDVRHADVRHSGDVRQSDVRHSGDVRQSEGRHGGPGARLSPPNFPSEHNNNNQTNQHDDLIHYIYESWNKVTREVERGGEDAKYYQEVVPPRQLANFRPFNLEEWWGRRLMQSLKRQQHRS